MNATLPRILAKGHELDLSEGSFGELRRSDDVASDFAALRSRFDEDGYLFIPGFFALEDILEARRHITQKLAEKGLLDPAYPVIEAVKKNGCRHEFPRGPAAGGGVHEFPGEAQHRDAAAALFREDHRAVRGFLW